MGYLSMKTFYYVLASMTYYVAIVLGAIFILDIGTIFDFVGAIAISAIAFLFPAFLFIMAVKKYKVPVEGTIATNIKLAYAFMLIGILVAALGIFSTIYSIINASD